MSDSLSQICPSCNVGRIVERKGRYGVFYGCSGWPKCTYTESERLHKSDWNDGWDDFCEWDDDFNDSWPDYIGGGR